MNHQLGLMLKLGITSITFICHDVFRLLLYLGFFAGLLSSHNSKIIIINVCLSHFSSL